MDTLFSFRRFGLLVNRHFSLQWVNYLIGGLVYAGVLVLLFLMVLSARRDVFSSGEQLMVYLLAAYGGLFVYTTVIFRAYQRPRHAAFHLLLPASTAEKFILGWGLSLMWYTLCANGIYFLVRFFVVQYAESHGFIVESLLQSDRLALLTSDDSGAMACFFVGLYLFVHAFTLLGSVWFRRHVAIKTALALLVFILVYRYAYVLLGILLLPSDVSHSTFLPFIPSYMVADGVTYTISVGFSPGWIATYCLVANGLLWFAAYYKLKEKEV